MSEATRLERTSHVVAGDRCELRLEDGRITVAKEATTQARPTHVSVPVDRVRGATLDRPAPGRPGWLHLAVVDGTPAPASDLAAASDPYTVPLTSRRLHAARRLVRMIEDHVRRRGLPHQQDRDAGHRSSGVILHADGATPAAGQEMPPPVSGPASGTSDPPISGEDLAGHLRDLAELHRAGALSDEEFERAKRRVLDT